MLIFIKTKEIIIHISSKKYIIIEIYKNQINITNNAFLWFLRSEKQLYSIVCSEQISYLRFYFIIYARYKNKSEEREI